MESTHPSVEESDCTNALSIDELALLHKLERRIERGIGGYREVGDDLGQIRDMHLYRRYYPSFARYCAERWGLARHQATRTIDAAIAAMKVGTAPPEDLRLPEIDRQTLASFPSNLRGEFWERFCKNFPNPTAEELRDEIDHFIGENFERFDAKAQVAVVNLSEADFAETARLKASALHSSLLDAAQKAAEAGEGSIERVLLKMAKKYDVHRRKQERPFEPFVIATQTKGLEAGASRM